MLHIPDYYTPAGFPADLESQRRELTKEIEVKQAELIILIEHLEPTRVRLINEINSGTYGIVPEDRKILPSTPITELQGWLNVYLCNLENSPQIYYIDKYRQPSCLQRIQKIKESVSQQLKTVASELNQVESFQVDIDRLQRKRAELEDVSAIIENNLWQGLKQAFEKVRQDSDTYYKITKLPRYTNTKILAESLKEIIDDSSSYYTDSEKCTALDGKIDKFSYWQTDNFIEQQLTILKKIMQAHKKNLELLGASDFQQDFSEQSIINMLFNPPLEDFFNKPQQTNPQPVSELPALNQEQIEPTHPVAVAGYTGTRVSRRHRDEIEVPVPGFFQNNAKPLSLLVATLPSIAYFSLEAFKEFILNLPLPPALTLTIAGIVLGLITYQALKPKENEHVALTF